MHGSQVATPGPWSDTCICCWTDLYVGSQGPSEGHPHHSSSALPCPSDPSEPHTSRRILWHSLKGGKGKTYVRLRTGQQGQAHAHGSTNSAGTQTRAGGRESCPRTGPPGKASCLTTVPRAGREQERCGHASRNGTGRGWAAGGREGSQGGRTQDRPLQCTLL